MINELIETNKLSEKITMLDNLNSSNPRGMVLNELKNADIFILPSKTASNGDCEGTPVVLMEASASGIPCITTRHSGNPEVIIHEKTGLVCEEGAIENLAKAIIELATNQEKRMEFGKNARLFMLENYNNQIQRENLLEIYKKAF